MSNYVKRSNSVTGRMGWVGPIRSAAQAQREVDAWNSSGNGWSAELVAVTPETRKVVNAWQRAADKRRAERA